MAIPVTFEQVTHNSPDGAQMGNATGSLNGFYGATPVVQPTSANQAVAVATGAAAAVTAVAVTQTAAATEAVSAIARAVTYTSNDPSPANPQTISDGNAISDAEITIALLGLETFSGEVAVDIADHKVAIDQAVVDLAAYKVEIDKLVLDVASQKVETDKIITDVALLITLSNQIRSELVTLGLIKGS